MDYEFLSEFIEGSFVTGLILVMGILLVIVGVLMYIGIRRKGKVLLMSFLLKGKRYDNETLKLVYSIQAGYTVVLGAIIAALILIDSVSNIVVVIVMLVFALLDLFYDIFAIRRALYKSTSKNTEFDDMMNKIKSE